MTWPGTEEERAKHQALADHLNALEVYTSEDGEALFMRSSPAAFYLEETFAVEGEPKSIWKVV